MALLMIIILLMPIDVTSKLECYLTMLLVITVYILIISGMLPENNDLSFCEILVKDVFLLTTFLTLCASFNILFSHENTSQYELPL